MHLRVPHHFHIVENAQQRLPRPEAVAVTRPNGAGRYLISVPSGRTANHTPPLPWPFVAPGASSPAKRYSGHLPACNWCVPSGRSIVVKTAASRPAATLGAPSTVSGGHASAHASVHVEVPFVS